MNFNRKVDEVRYLTAENSERYRAIMHSLFEAFNGMRYWLYKEEIFDILKSYPRFEQYTMEQLKSDLESLLEWKNLLADTDTKRVKSIQEFRNREFKYQISKSSIEIERMLILLENLDIESTSQLNSNFIFKFVKCLEHYKDIDSYNPKEIYE